MGTLGAGVVAAVLVFVFSGDTAREVSVGQAVQRLGGQAGTSAGDRPRPGVYEYHGSGTETLSVPRLSQSEGPVVPGTVTLRGADCWVLRIDYSSHHWQTYRYCRHGGATWEEGGQTWHLWAIGPVNVTNLATLTCAPGTMSLPAAATPGQRWPGRCSGSSSAVAGTVVSAGPYTYVGPATVPLSGRAVHAARFVRLRTDSGSQHGSERTEVWLDAVTGLPLRIDQRISVTSGTPFGDSRYTQSSNLVLTSLVART